MQEKKVTNISLSTFLFIIALIIIVIMTIFIYKLNNEKTIETQKSIDLQAQINSLNATVSNLQGKINTVSENVSSANISVEDAINYTDNYYHLFKIKLPRIVGNTNTIKELNQKILNEVLPKTYTDIVMHAQVSESLDKGSTCEYKYIIKNNILVLYIYTSIPEGGTGIPASGDGINSSYFYDIEHDKILTQSEAANKLSLSLSGLTTRNGEQIKSYSELEENGYLITIDNNNLKLKFLN